MSVVALTGTDGQLTVDDGLTLGVNSVDLIPICKVGGSNIGKDINLKN